MYTILLKCVCVIVIQDVSDCKNGSISQPPPIPQADRILYNTILTHPLKAVAELNNNKVITNYYEPLLGMFKAYPTAGIQVIRLYNEYTLYIDIYIVY